MKIKKPWLAKDGKELSIDDLKMESRTWNEDTWKKYLNWYESPLKEELISPKKYNHICENMTESVFDAWGDSALPGEINSQSILQTLSSVEAKFIKLNLLEGFSISEAAKKIGKTKWAALRLRKKVILKLKRKFPGGDRAKGESQNEL